MPGDVQRRLDAARARPVPNANVSIEQLANRFQAHTELPVPVRFDDRTLRTLGVDAELPNGRIGTAHPHHDPRTGERFSYEIELVPPSGLRMFSERRGAAANSPSSPRSAPGYLHSFGADAPLRGRAHPALGVRPRPASRPSTARSRDLRVGRLPALADPARRPRARRRGGDRRARALLRVPPHQRLRRRRPGGPGRLRAPRQLDRRRDVPEADPRERIAGPPGEPAPDRRSSRAAGASASATWPRGTSSCPASTTTRSTEGPIATRTESARAMPARAASSTGSPSSTSSAASRSTGTIAAPTRASRSSSAGPAGVARTTAPCSRSSSTRRAGPHICSCSMPGTCPSSPAPRFRITSRSASTGCTPAASRASAGRSPPARSPRGSCAALRAASRIPSAWRRRPPRWRRARPCPRAPAAGRRG